MVTPVGSSFTASGQLAGSRVTIYGDSWTSGIGNAAQPQLIEAGYWIPVSGASKTWYMTVTYRAAAMMCSGDVDSNEIGDRLVINQGSLDYSVPLTARDANAAGYVPGSCSM